MSSRISNICFYLYIGPHSMTSQQRHVSIPAVLEFHKGPVIPPHVSVCSLSIHPIIRALHSSKPFIVLYSIPLAAKCLMTDLPTFPVLPGGSSYFTSNARQKRLRLRPISIKQNREASTILVFDVDQFIWFARKWTIKVTLIENFILFYVSWFLSKLAFL